MKIYPGDFWRFVFEGEVRSMDPAAKKTSNKDDKEDYLDALDDELGADWKKGALKDKFVVKKPMEVGHYYYKTSAWKVLDANAEQVTIQLDPESTPNLVHNVFRKTAGGQYERVGPNGPFDTEPKTIPRKQYNDMLSADLAAQAAGGGGAPPGGPGAPPGGDPMGGGAPPGAPPGGPPGAPPM